jgi:hypothetical protein
MGCLSCLGRACVALGFAQLEEACPMLSRGVGNP